MSLAWLIQYGTPALILLLVVFAVITSERLKQLKKSIFDSNGDIAEIKNDLKDMKTRIVWEDVFNGLNDRVKRIEDILDRKGK